jgi:hypothetical protein
VQVLDEQQERLDLALPQQQTLHGVQRPLPALRGIEPPPRLILDRDLQEREQRRQEGSRARSRDRTLPVTFSRMVRVSSRPSMWKYALSRSMTGDRPWPCRRRRSRLQISQPWTRWEWVNSQ